MFGFVIIGADREISVMIILSYHFPTNLINVSITNLEAVASV